MYIQFEWDSDKAKSNLKKHGVSFEEAQTVFYDADAKIIFDPDHSEDEERFILLGMSQKLKVMVVCHCYRKNNEIIRIISARKATKKECSQYRR